MLRSVFTTFADIPEDEWRHFLTFVRDRRYAPRDHLIHEGRADSSIHYIVSGLVRLYYNEEGRELVRGFDYEGRFVTAYDVVLTGEAAAFSVQAIEHTNTLAFDGDILRVLYDRHPCWDRFGRRILEEQWIRQSDKSRRFRVLGAEEHYRLLIQRKSPLLDRVPLNQLASFLAITPETLSRIRARLRDEEPDSAGA